MEMIFDCGIYVWFVDLNAVPHYVATCIPYPVRVTWVSCRFTDVKKLASARL